MRAQQGTACSPTPYLEQNGATYYIGNSSVYWQFDFDPSQSSSSNLGFPGDLYFDAAGLCNYTYTNIEGSIALSFVEGGVRYVYGTPNGEYGAWWNSGNVPTGTIAGAMTPIAVTQISAPGSDPLVVTASFLAGDARVDWTVSVGSAGISIPYSVTVTAPQTTSISNVSLYHAYDLDDLNGGDSSPGADGLYESGQIGSVNSLLAGIGISAYTGASYQTNWDLSIEDQTSLNDTFQKVLTGAPFNNYPEGSQLDTNGAGAGADGGLQFQLGTLAAGASMSVNGQGGGSRNYTTPPSPFQTDCLGDADNLWTAQNQNVVPQSTASINVNIKRFYGALSQTTGQPQSGQLNSYSQSRVESCDGTQGAATLQLEAFGVETPASTIVTVDSCRPASSCPTTVIGSWHADPSTPGWWIFTGNVSVSVLSFPNLDTTAIAPPFDAFNTVTVGGTSGGTAIAWARFGIVGVRPVLLVHGISPNDLGANILGQAPNPNDISGWSTWQDWAKCTSTGFLQQLGAPNVRCDEENPNQPKVTQGSDDPTSPDYYPSDARVFVSGSARVDDNVSVVQNWISMVTMRYGVQKVNIVAHSKGGLDSSASLLDGTGRVKKLIMLATPYEGTPFADKILGDTALLPIILAASGQPEAGVATADLRQLLIANFPAILDLTLQHWNDEGVLPSDGHASYYGVAGANSRMFQSGAWDVADRWIYRDNCQFLGVLGCQVDPNDGAVPVYSVQSILNNGGYSNFLGTVNDTHLSITQNILTHSDQEALIKPLLDLPDAKSVGASAALAPHDFRAASQARRSAAMQVSTPQLPQSGPGIMGSVSPNTTVRESFTVGPNSGTSVLFGWDHDVLQLSLVAPDGTIITPNGQNVTVTSTVAITGGGIIEYDLQSAAPGTWTAIITNTGTLGQASDFALSTSFVSPLTLTPLTAPLYQATTPSTAAVSLLNNGAPIVGAIVTATAILSGTQPVTISLSDQGSGIYTGSFGALTPGRYAVFLTATGQANPVFAVTGFTTIDVSPGNASLGGQYSEGITTDKLGLISALAITPTIDVAANGVYSLKGELTDQAGNVVAVASAQANLSTGQGQPLALTFDGQSIGTSGVDGPYQLRNLTLSDNSSGAVLIDDQAPLAYTTQYYSAGQFARPLIQILPGTTDAGTNLNAIGTFGNLTVAFTTTAALTDTYTILATLADARGSYITAITQSASLGYAPMQLQLQFSGPDIVAQGEDGPYHVVGVTFIPQSRPTTYTSFPGFWTTQFYHASDFSPAPVTPTDTPTTTNTPNPTSTNTAVLTSTPVPASATATATTAPSSTPTAVPASATPTNTPVPLAPQPTNTAVAPNATPTTGPAPAAPTSTIAHNTTIAQPNATRTPISQVAGVTRTQPTCARPAVTRILVNGKALTKGTQLLSGQMVAVRVHAAPRMSVQTLIDLTHTVTTTTGTGRHRKTVKRTVVVGHVAATATTNRTGDATGYARIAYVPATTAMVTLKVGAHAACGGSVTLASSAMRLKPAYVTPMVSVSLPNGKPLAGATIQTNSAIVVRVDAAENTPVKIEVTLHVQGSKESVTYTAPSNARQAEPRTGTLDGYLMEQVRIPYEPRHYKVGATLAVTVSARSTVGKKQRTLTATTGALHVTLQSERPPQRVRHR